MKLSKVKEKCSQVLQACVMDNQELLASLLSSPEETKTETDSSDLDKDSDGHAPAATATRERRRRKHREVGDARLNPKLLLDKGAFFCKHLTS